MIDKNENRPRSARPTPFPRHRNSESLPLVREGQQFVSMESRLVDWLVGGEFGTDGGEAVLPAGEVVVCSFDVRKATEYVYLYPARRAELAKQILNDYWYGWADGFYRERYFLVLPYARFAEAFEAVDAARGA